MSVHPYANPLTAVKPSPPPPIRGGSTWGLSSPAPLPSISTRGDDNDERDDVVEGGGSGSGSRGDQAVNGEYAFGSRRGLSMRSGGGRI